MATIIDLSEYQKKEEIQQTQQTHLDENHSSEDLGTAIQTLILQLRKEPLQRIG